MRCLDRNYLWDYQNIYATATNNTHTLVRANLMATAQRRKDFLGFSSRLVFVETAWYYYFAKIPRINAS